VLVGPLEGAARAAATGEAIAAAAPDPAVLTGPKRAATVGEGLSEGGISSAFAPGASMAASSDGLP